MAGRDHYYIWQLLQRGFGVENFRKHHIWVFEKSKPPRQTTTDNFGSDKYFYGPKDSAADINITNFENKVQGLVQQWRSLPDDTAVAKEQVLPIVASLEARSAFLRSEFETTVADLLQSTQESVSKASNISVSQQRP